jgi:hypothetical protein|tara:strand:- start:87 stop:218 length:132 start_codon:yes stop_codon:yes gene_type:complete
MDRVDKPEELESRTRDFNAIRFGYCTDCEKMEWAEGLDSSGTL